jgi:hypothetical protein
MLIAKTDFHISVYCSSMIWKILIMQYDLNGKLRGKEWNRYDFVCFLHHISKPRIFDFAKNAFGLLYWYSQYSLKILLLKITLFYHVFSCYFLFVKASYQIEIRQKNASCRILSTEIISCGFHMQKLFWKF